MSRFFSGQFGNTPPVTKNLLIINIDVPDYCDFRSNVQYQSAAASNCNSSITISVYGRLYPDMEALCIFSSICGPCGRSAKHWRVYGVLYLFLLFTTWQQV